MGKKRVLVVDDDEVLRSSLKAVLENQGYDITLAQGGRIAQHLVEAQPFDVIVTDLMMPDGSGNDLIQFMRSNKLTNPVVVLSGYVGQPAAKMALVHGADELVPKPFSHEDIVEVVAACCGEDHDSLARLAVEDEYCGLRLDDFISGRVVVGDLFIRLSDSKFVRVAAAGEAMPADQLANYRQRNVEHLYMKKDDFRRYIGMNVAVAQAIRSEGSISRLRKLKFLRHTAETILARAMLQGVDEEGFGHAKSILETTTSLLCDETDSYAMLLLMRAHSDQLYAHGLAVGVYSAMLARQLGWTVPSTLFKLSAGGLFHDIGTKELDPQLLQKSRHNMTAAEIKIYETHPTRGLEILGAVRSIPSDVLQIVAQHHEDCLGSGYPAGLKQRHIHPMARVVAVVDAFCELALDGPGGPGANPQWVIQRLIETRAATLHLPMLQGLAGLFKRGAEDARPAQAEKRLAG